MNLFEEILISTGLGSSELLRITSSAPARYKVYAIPKRRGGQRIIAQPSRELKLLQRFLIERVLSRYSVHPAAAAYVKHKNIKENASEHVENRVVLKLDFQDFFPSIRVSDWRQFFSKNPLDVDVKDLNLLTQILFWGRGTPLPHCLSIGAPSSPILSNILMFGLDDQIHRLTSKHDVAYTRYADDITLSARSFEALLPIEAEVRKIVAQTKSPRLLFNDQKRGLYSRGQKRMVTGLILTPDTKISIGRPRKRMISSLIHKYTLNALSMEQIGILKGYLGFALSNEPVFVDSMRKKYGSDIVARILRTHIPKRSEMRGAKGFLHLE